MRRREFLADSALAAPLPISRWTFILEVGSRLPGSLTVAALLYGFASLFILFILSEKS
jgi:hypothetical protein